MSLIEQIKAKAFKIGYFHVYKSWDDTHLQFEKEYDKRLGGKTLGPVLYFLFVDGELTKIGKTVNLGVRLSTYKQGRSRGEATNTLIMDTMKYDDKTKDDVIEMYGIKVPHVDLKYKCPLTGNELNESVDMITNLERRYTHLYLAESGGKRLSMISQIPKKYRN